MSLDAKNYKNVFPNKFKIQKRKWIKLRILFVFLLLCTNSHNYKIEMEDGREAGSKPSSKY